MQSLKNHTANGLLVSVVSFEREAKSSQQKNAEIKKLTAEIATIKRWYSDNVLVLKSVVICYVMWIEI